MGIILLLIAQSRLNIKLTGQVGETEPFCAGFHVRPCSSLSMPGWRINWISVYCMGVLSGKLLRIITQPVFIVGDAEQP
jgi:hypothetical protein